MTNETMHHRKPVGRPNCGQETPGALSGTKDEGTNYLPAGSAYEAKPEHP
jgi:hypothetical protein